MTLGESLLLKLRTEIIGLPLGTPGQGVTLMVLDFGRVIYLT